MKYITISLAAALLLMVGLTTARSLPNKQKMKEVIVNRREAESKDEGDAVTSNLTEFQAELANTSLPSYLKDLYINFTYLGRDHLLDHENINTVRTYDNQAECKHIVLLFYIT